MTDKELRKLSRLELLELLLKESKENKRLKEELEKIKKENTIGKATEQLKETAVQFDASLQNADALIVTLQKMISTPPAQNSRAANDQNSNGATEAAAKKANDAELYKRIMLFFARNMNYLSHLPDELREDVAKRLTELLKKR